MIVRRERPSDVAAARAIHVAAFPPSPEGGEPVEAALLDALRADAGWLPEHSWVAERDGVVIGHAVCTRGHVAGVPALGLGPIGVLPSEQGSGAGSALVHALVGAADATGEPLIALLGDPGYYGRFGFMAAARAGVEAPDPAWGEHFQVLALTARSDTARGRFTYAAPFAEL